MTKCMDWEDITVEPAEGITIPDKVRCTADATKKLLDLELCGTHYDRRAPEVWNLGTRTIQGIPDIPDPEDVEHEDRQEIGFVLVVRNSGKREHVTQQVTQALCAHLERAFGHLTEEQRAKGWSEPWELRLEDGRWIEYDYLAADGEHVGHDQVLRIAARR
jgi:hypothetical protein